MESGRRTSHRLPFGYHSWLKVKHSKFLGASVPSLLSLWLCELEMSRRKRNLLYKRNKKGNRNVTLIESEDRRRKRLIRRLIFKDYQRREKKMYSDSFSNRNTNNKITNWDTDWVSCFTEGVLVPPTPEQELVSAVWTGFHPQNERKQRTQWNCRHWVSVSPLACRACPRRNHSHADRLQFMAGGGVPPNEQLPNQQSLINTAYCHLVGGWMDRPLWPAN